MWKRWRSRGVARRAIFQQEGTVQVTLNGSTYTNHTARLNTSLSGVWAYRFSQAQLAQLTLQIAGESQEQAKATLENVEGIIRVSTCLQRLDYKESLPTNPQHITMQLFYIVS